MSNNLVINQVTKDNFSCSAALERKPTTCYFGPIKKGLFMTLVSKNKTGLGEKEEEGC